MTTHHPTPAAARAATHSGPTAPVPAAAAPPPHVPSPLPPAPTLPSPRRPLRGDPASCCTSHDWFRVAHTQPSRLYSIQGVVLFPHSLSAYGTATYSTQGALRETQAHAPPAAVCRPGLAASAAHKFRQIQAKYKHKGWPQPLAKASTQHTGVQGALRLRRLMPPLLHCVPPRPCGVGIHKSRQRTDIKNATWVWPLASGTKWLGGGVRKCMLLLQRKALAAVTKA